LLDERTNVLRLKGYAGGLRAVTWEDSTRRLFEYAVEVAAAK